MKKINLPRTKFEDYVNCRRMVITNYMGLKKEGISEEKIDGIIDFMYDRFFKDKIFVEDFYSFNNLNGVENFLLEFEYFSLDKINECIDHEKEHLDKINEFGYSVNGFSVCLLSHKDEVTFSARILLNKKGVSLNKFKEIVFAPKNLSLTDRLFM